MSGFWRDEDFQEKLLMFVCRDRNFLKKTSGLLSPKDFEPRKGEGMEAAYIIAQKAFKYWNDYREPIGGMLKTEVLDHLREFKGKIANKTRDKVLELVEKIRKAEGLVAVEAIERKVIEYKQRQNKRNAVKDLINLQEKGELTDRAFRKICRDALETYDNTLNVSDYTDEGAVKKRIRRREKNKDRKMPLLMIKEFDIKYNTAPRGEINIALAKYSVGKSTFAIHISQAYALQGLNVLLFTLEDPKEWVEDRLDASFTGIEMKQLMQKSSKLKRRLRKKLLIVRGKIKVIDGTDGNMTIQRIEEIWENYRNQGFDADVIIIDADEGVTPPEKYKGDSGERREVSDIYHAYKTFLARRLLFGWIMAQTKRGKTGQRKMIVAGDDAATDISKLRRCAVCIGIGDGPEDWGDDGRYIYMAKNRYGRARKGFPIVGRFAKAVFYDAARTKRYNETRMNKHGHN